MATSCESTPANQDCGSTSEVDVVTAEVQSQDDNVDVDLASKFSAFCDLRTKEHFTSKACNKLVKDCFEEHFKFKKVILTNRIDSSVFSKCKEKGKPHMLVNKGNCEKFLQYTAHEFAKLKTGDDKLSKDDETVDKMLITIKDKVTKSTGPKIKTVKMSTTGNIDGLTDTKKYTGSHKLRFDESGKGRGKAGRCDEGKKSGYVASYKGEGTFEEEQK